MMMADALKSPFRNSRTAPVQHAFDRQTQAHLHQPCAHLKKISIANNLHYIIRFESI